MTASADKTYSELSQQYGAFEQFWLYRKSQTGDWYADVTNIPGETPGGILSPTLAPAPQVEGPLQVERAGSRVRLRQLLRALQQELARESEDAEQPGCDGCP